GVRDGCRRLAAPGERVPHGRGRRDHRAGRIHGVAAALEDHGTGGGRERLAGDRHPVRAVERGLLGARLGARQRGREQHGRGGEETAEGAGEAGGGGGGGVPRGGGVLFFFWGGGGAATWRTSTFGRLPRPRGAG